ncbi:MAG: phosphoglycolate phosphatase [Coxiellaceae bacterium]|nr:phosphoglycolate phosphatase [Coxiellaceae bacterium]
MSALTILLIMKNNFDAIFFDLDGTLLDTAPDLYAAMHNTLAQMGYEMISFDRFRPHIHSGTASMIKGSLGIDENDPLFEEVKQTFLSHYENQVDRKTDYFPGVSDLLKHLDQENIPWGIITNKPGFLAEPLLRSFGLDQRSQCVISGDTLPRKKPYPDQLFHACELVNVSPSQCIYVGDTEGDIAAAKAAGMHAIAVCYGYHHPTSKPDSWGADHIINEASQLIDVL